MRGVAIVSITNYNYDLSGWRSAVGTYTPIDFTGFADETAIDDEYAALGVMFTDSDPNWIEYYAADFPLDDWGVHSDGPVELTFSQVMHGVGAHIPGATQIQLFLGDVFMGQGTPGVLGGVGKFVGPTSDIGFDRARFIPWPPDPFVTLHMDNVYFSTTPAPPAVSLLLLGGLIGSRRRAR